ncbi:MAG: hypothetical protein AAF327_02225 [Cyanobacteria bacterium P01_A01_bin.37]
MKLLQVLGFMAERGCPVAIALGVVFLLQGSALAMPSAVENLPIGDRIDHRHQKSNTNLSNTNLSEPFWVLTSDASMQLAQRLDADQLDLDPMIIEESPVLQRWLEETPDILEDIRRDPAFRTRVRAAYANVDEDGGFLVSVDDVFLGETGLTLNGDYGQTFEGDHQSWGVTLRYYTLPLGNGVNLAPLVGYRELDTPDDDIDGVAVGLRLLLVPSRTGAADISVSQVWINPGSDSQESSLTTFTAGYALTQDVRLSSDIQIQLTPNRQDTRFSLGLEFML